MREDRRQRRHDGLLLIGAQVGRHRQADDLAGLGFGDRQAAGRDRIGRVDALPVDRDRLVERGRDALFAKLGRQGVSAPAWKIG